MKVSSVNNTIIPQRKDAKSMTPQRAGMLENPSQQAAPSFKGGGDPTTFLIDMWAAIARGGLAASFTVQDMFGTNFPRTFAALDRNKDITGKNNYKAAVEVAIREFTTGPSMFIIPALVLTGATRFSSYAGEANRVAVDNIAVFSDIMKGTMNNLHTGAFKGVDFANMSTAEAKEACNSIKEAFYTDVFRGIFAQYGEEGSNINVKEYVDLMMKAEHPDTPKRNFFMSMFNKKVTVLGKQVDSKDEIISQLSTKFVADKKAHTKGWGDFLSAKITPDSKTLNIGAIVDDMKNFSTDFAKQYISTQRKNMSGSKIVLEKFINNFRDMRMGSRFVTNVLMVVATGMFMSIIPKLYTRNKTNPETDAIYELVNQQRKGAVNENR